MELKIQAKSSMGIWIIIYHSLDFSDKSSNSHFVMG